LRRPCHVPILPFQWARCCPPNASHERPRFLRSARWPG
jgi:hypothetical protein